MELKEPDLVFSNRAGTATVLDPHPVRGIVNNRPFDYALTARNLASPIQCGLADLFAGQDLCTRRAKRIANAPKPPASKSSVPGSGTGA